MSKIHASLPPKGVSLRGRDLSELQDTVVPEVNSSSPSQDVLLELMPSPWKKHPGDFSHSRQGSSTEEVVFVKCTSISFVGKSTYSETPSDLQQDGIFLHEYFDLRKKEIYITENISLHSGYSRGKSWGSNRTQLHYDVTKPHTATTQPNPNNSHLWSGPWVRWDQRY